MLDGNTHHRSLSTDHAAPAGVIAAVARVDGAMAVLPAGFPLRQATFRRRMDYLAVQAPGHAAMIVPQFFRTSGPTTIVTEDGVEVSRHMVLLMLNLSERVERVLGELSAPGAGER
jgi:hypothetical protein